MDENDILLIEQLKKGEEKAYIFLFKHYYDRLYRFAAHYLYDPDEAHDIVQDLFTNLLDKRETLHIATSIKAYLFMAVRNRCLSFLRNVQIKDSYKQSVLEAHLNSDTVDAIMDDQSMLDELQMIMDKMPPGMREVFRLRIVEDYKFKEIAEALGITENSAKVQMSGAIRMIREKLPLMKRRLIVLFLWYYMCVVIGWVFVIWTDIHVGKRCEKMSVAPNYPTPSAVR